MLAGAGCALFVDGLAGQLLTMSLMLGGLAGAVFLLFLEVGLSEEAERAKEARRVGEREAGGDQEEGTRHGEGRSRLGRSPRRRRSG